jgi:hypothetical protein
MLNPWLAITFQAARLGFEAQNAAALQLMRLVGGTSKTEVRGMVADQDRRAARCSGGRRAASCSGGRDKACIRRGQKA